MSKESFQYPGSQEVYKLIEEVSQRSSVSRAVAWEDFLQCSVSALGHPLMEEEYLRTIEKHKEGSVGKRGVDAIAKAFGTLVHQMTLEDVDILGDIHQGIALPEHQQYMTPQPIAEMMARLSLPEEQTGLEGRRTVNDCCAGSGRMLLAALKIQPHWHAVAQDIDRRCVMMCAINLALRNHYGHVVWGNTLTNEAKLIYETGRMQLYGNVIRQVNRVPLPNREPEVFDMPETDTPTTSPTATSPMPTPPERSTTDSTSSPTSTHRDDTQPPSDPNSPRRQLKLF
ncbi:MAG: N-6 DNA methylase [Planctomycetaceae bacterium]